MDPLLTAPPWTDPGETGSSWLLTKLSRVSTIVDPGQNTSEHIATVGFKHDTLRELSKLKSVPQKTEAKNRRRALQMSHETKENATRRPPQRLFSGSAISNPSSDKNSSHQHN